MRYQQDPALQQQVDGLVRDLGFQHIPPGRVKVLRSQGSKSRRTLARIHALPKILQKGLGLEAHYVIEVISEHFDPLSSEEQTKTLIHELLHIPASFGGGFRHHRTHVNRRTVDKAYKLLREREPAGLFAFLR